MKIKELLYCLGEAPISIWRLKDEDHNSECLFKGMACDYDGDMDLYIVSGGLYAVDNTVIIEVSHQEE